MVGRKTTNRNQVIRRPGIRKWEKGDADDLMVVLRVLDGFGIVIIG